MEPQDILKGMRTLTFVVLLIAGCTNPGEQVVYTRGHAFGTTYEIQIIDRQSQLDQIKPAVDGLLSSIDQDISHYNPNSAISQFNQRGTQWQEFNQSTFALIQESIEIAQWTTGAFDPTVSNLVDLWGFYEMTPQRAAPTQEHIVEMLPSTGHEKLVFDVESKRIRKTEANLRLDLSAIGKGYAVDQIAALLRAQGVDNFLVEIGGEISAGGTKANGEPWSVGIQDPANPGSVVAIATLTDGVSLATSGNYRNFFETNGTQYSHLIDPVTGASQQGPLSSVTVVHEKTAVADALATALMVMPWPASLAWAEQSNIAALFVVERADERIHTTSPMREFLQKKKRLIPEETQPQSMVL